MIARHPAPPLLVLLACTVCGMGQDPFEPPIVGAADSAPATSRPPSPPTPTPTPTRTVTPSAEPTGTHPAQATLPRGGRTIFPRYRLVGYAGVTGALKRRPEYVIYE
jgi:hypothetical protein